MEALKKCKKCLQIKDVSCFGIRNDKKDGYNARCKLCVGYKIKTPLPVVTIFGEEWRGIKRYDGAFEISNFGRIKRLPRLLNTKTHGSYSLNEKILTPCIHANGYYAVCITHKGKQYTIELHRLLAEEFIPNSKNNQDVNHINNIRTDNRLENLEWVSRRENCCHGSKFNIEKSSIFVGVFHNSIKKSNKWSAHYQLNGKLIHLGYFNSESDAANSYNNALKGLSIDNKYLNLI